MGIYNPLNTVFHLQLPVGFSKFMKIPENRFNIAFQGIMEHKDTSMELAKRFPEYASQITDLLLTNDDFREIADDYKFCIHKLNRLSANPNDNHPLIRHYKKTVIELEEELQGYFMNDKIF